MAAKASVMWWGLVAPMIGAVTCGFCATQAKATRARGTPRSAATAATRSTISRSWGWYRVAPKASDSVRSVVSSQSRVSRPRASGLQGMMPMPWSATGNVAEQGQIYPGFAVKVSDTFDNGIQAQWVQWSKQGPITLAADSVITLSGGVSTIFGTASNFSDSIKVTATAPGLVGSPRTFTTPVARLFCGMLSPGTST